MILGSAVISLAAVICEKSFLPLIARERSPSVKIPTGFCLSLTIKQPRCFLAIMPIASVPSVSSDTHGSSSRLCITSFTLRRRRRPRAPAGWLRAKSSAWKFLATINAPAMASPKTIVIVVEAVGARFNGHASRSIGVTSATSAACANELVARPVIAIMGMPIALRAGMQVCSSEDSPENERPIT